MYVNLQNVLLSKFVRVVTALTCIGEVAGSNLTHDTNNREILCAFPHSLQENFWTAGLTLYIHSDSLFTITQSFDTTYSSY